MNKAGLYSKVDVVLISMLVMWAKWSTYFTIIWIYTLFTQFEKIMLASKPSNEINKCLRFSQSCN